MKKINIEATSESPEIILDAEKGVFLIRGKSVISNAQEFYVIVFKWLEELEELEGEMKGSIDFVFDLDYFNVTSSKRFLFILYRLKQLRRAGIEVNVVWYFSDKEDDMREIGEDYSFMADIPFQFVGKALETKLVS